jgi:hypothetical protein
MCSVTLRAELKRCERFDNRILTNGFATLLERTEEDFLGASILRGVPTWTELIFGKTQFTLHDLKTLPCLSDFELTERGIWKLYVGPASGQFGVAQR